MEKECCQVKVTELDDGYRFEITGKDVKNKCSCWEVLQKCCETHHQTGNKETCC